MFSKREILKKFITENKIYEYSIIGRPKNYVIELYDNNDTEGILNKIGISINDKIFKRKVAIYFPKVKRGIIEDVCYVSVRGELAIEDLYKLEDLFNNIYGYYQVDITPLTLLKVIGVADEAISLHELLKVNLKLTNNDISGILNKSKQNVSDMINDKVTITSKSLSILMLEYPLMPWQEFIIGL